MRILAERILGSANALETTVAKENGKNLADSVRLRDTPLRKLGA
jgi:hypothetical protein